MSKNIIEKFCLFFLCLIIFTIGLQSAEIIGFESRFYLFAQEMWRNGLTWFPTIYHTPYPDYPPTSTWLIYFTALAFGSLSKLSAVFPSALAAALTALLTYQIGALRDKRLACYSVIFLLFTYTFLKSARTISLDLFITLITTTCFYLLYSADCLAKRQRVWWMYPLLFLGFMFRGPIGLVMPMGVIAFYYLIDKQYKKLIITGIAAIFILNLCCIFLLLLAHHVGGNEFVQQVLHMQIISRVTNSDVPVYFYFMDGLANYAISYPTAVFVMIGILYYRNKIASKDLNLLLKLIAWLFVIMLGMSIPGDKKIRYVLPMMPAAALIAAYLYIAPNNIKYFQLLRGMMTRLFLIFPCLIFILILYVKQYSFLHTFLAASFVFALQLIACVIWRYSGIHSKDLKIAVLAFCSFLTLYFFIIEPIELYIDRTRNFVVKAESMRAAKKADLVFLQKDKDGMAIKYMINTEQTITPIFMNDITPLTTPSFYFMDEKIYRDLPEDIAKHFSLVMKGRMGHSDVVVIENH